HPLERRHPVARQPAPDARGAVPPHLRRRDRVVTTLTGTGRLVRFHLHPDRVRIVVWILAILGLGAAATSSVKPLHPTRADLQSAAKAARDNVVALVFKGPAQALDTIGGQVAFQIVAFGIVAVALMSLLTMVTLTRAEEESGRLELIRALPVGRAAPLAAAVANAPGTHGP